MEKLRYIFEKGNKKGVCPSCLKIGKWRFYIDTTTGDRLPEQYGVCERRINCNHSLSPYPEYANNVFEIERGKEGTPIIYKQQPAPKELKPPAYIPESVLIRSLVNADTNTLLYNLKTGNGIKRPFTDEIIQQIVTRYKVGVSNASFKGATTFPFIDINGNIQAIQVKAFDENSHTAKYIDKNGEKQNKQSTIHKIISKECDKAKVIYPEWLTAYNDYQNNGGKIFNCFFGENLINEDKYKPVAIVEAPKTAIVCSVYFPQFIWLSVGALSYLTFDRCKVLKGRNVVLFPDLNCFDKWSAKAESLKSIADFKVFPFLEQNATDEERAKDLDLCDYLLQYDYLEFTGHETLENKEKQNTIDQLRVAMRKPVELWDIEALENSLKNIDIPIHPIKLSQQETIEDCSLFVSNHLQLVKVNNGNRNYKPYYERLQKFIQAINN